MIIGITINNILRNHLEKLSEAYEVLTGKEPITPINPYDLETSFPKIEAEITEDEFNVDNFGISLTPSQDDISFDVYNFMYSDASFEVFGRSEQTNDNMINKLSLLQDKDTEIVLMNKESPRTKCATLFFLSKANFNFNRIIFPNEYKDFWKYCDVLVTDNPNLLKKKRKNKIIIKVQNDFNLDYVSDFTILNINELSSILDDVKNRYNDNKSKKIIN